MLTNLIENKINISKTVLRISADIFFFSSVIISVWWFWLIVGILFCFYFSRYYEFIIGFILFISLLAQPDGGTSYYFMPIASLSVFFAVDLLKRRLKYYEL